MKKHGDRWPRDDRDPRIGYERSRLSRLSCIIALAAPCVSCRQGDTTQLTGAVAEGPRRETVRSESAAPGSGLPEVRLAQPAAAQPVDSPPIAAESLDAGFSKADAGPETTPASAPQLPTSCPLRVEWRDVTSSALGCEPFSAALAANLAAWNGSVLSLAGAAWQAAGENWQRGRSCDRNGNESWRFLEVLRFDAPLPSGRCPEGVRVAQYHYSECPLLTGGLPCPEPSACSFDAQLVLTPETSAPDALGDAGAPASEAACREWSGIGAGCTGPLDCVEGAYCSRQQPEGGCVGLGAGVCAPAPQLACPADPMAACTCDGLPVLQERVCLCDQPPIEIPGVNACFLRATGETTLPCP